MKICKLLCSLSVYMFKCFFLSVRLKIPVFLFHLFVGSRFLLVIRHKFNVHKAFKKCSQGICFCEFERSKSFPFSGGNVGLRSRIFSNISGLKGLLCFPCSEKKLKQPSRELPAQS